jgi:hypothetical protein
MDKKVFTLAVSSDSVLTFACVDNNSVNYFSTSREIENLTDSIN